jgi:hypothetical protein
MVPADAGTEPKDPKEKLWDDTYDTVLYPIWMEELVNAWLLSFWTRVNVVGALFTAVTSTGSAIAIWPLWGKEGYRWIWGIVAGCAALSSVFLTVFGVPERVRSQGKAYSEFLRLRWAVLAFCQDIDSMEVAEAQKVFRELRERGHSLIASAQPDIALTRRRRAKIQRELDAILSKEGYAL